MNKLYGYVSYPYKADLMSHILVTSEKLARCPVPDFEITTAKFLWQVAQNHDVIQRPNKKEMAGENYSIYMARRDLSFWGKESE